MTAQNQNTQRITIDVDTDTLEALDEIKARHGFKSRSELLAHPMGIRNAVLEIDEMLTDIAQDDSEAPNVVMEAPAPFQSDMDRVLTPEADDPPTYAGKRIGDDVTLFFRNPRRGFIARIWKTAKGHRFVVRFKGKGYAVLKPVDLQRAEDAAREAHRIKTRREALQNAA